MKRNKILSLALAAVLALALAVPAFATTTIGTSGGNATPNLTIDAAATTFNVTVPTSLNISVDNNSTATVGKGYIVNNSTGVVEVRSIKLTDVEYYLTAYDSQTKFSTYDVGSKKLGLSIAFGAGANDADLPELTGTAQTYVTGRDFTSGNVKTLAPGTLKIAAAGDTANNNKLYINPTASVSPTGANAVEADTVAASMVIVLGWYTGTGA